MAVATWVQIHLENLDDSELVEEESELQYLYYGHVKQASSFLAAAD